jgi:hypothetical protein
MAGYIKTFLRDWNPARNRRLVLLAESQLANCQNGWGNTHMEMLDYRDKCKHLESEIARLERLNNG